MRNQAGVVVLSSMNGFMVPFLFPAVFYVLGLKYLEKAKNLAGKVLRLIQDWLNDVGVCKKFGQCVNTNRRKRKSPVSSSRKRGRLFIRSHNEMLAVSAVRVSNQDCSRLWNQRLRAQPK